ncbi:hypothetical protein FKM82_000859 [Ascaphus truei]
MPVCIVNQPAMERCAHILPRKKALEDILCRNYTIQDPWKLALFTRGQMENKTSRSSVNPVIADIEFFHTFFLKPVTTVEKGRKPSLQTIQEEKKIEARRLNKIDIQSKAISELQSQLVGKKVGTRCLLSQL